jgi:hypothetical protein
MIYPDTAGVEPPNPDLNPDIKEDYNEARSIANKSPRGAAALLRLCIQKLCIQLGEPGNNLNNDIGSLVKKGLPKEVQQSLDAVRVIGAEAVHPLEMDLKDDRTIVNTLFRHVNFIARRLISEKKEIEEFYEDIPESKKKGIEDRDKKR